MYSSEEFDKNMRNEVVEVDAAGCSSPSRTIDGGF